MASHVTEVENSEILENSDLLEHLPDVNIIIKVHNFGLHEHIGQVQCSPDGYDNSVLNVGSTLCPDRSLQIQ